MNAHHVIFCPKYRRDCLHEPGVAAEVEKHMRHICAFHGITILALSIQSDHIHLFIDIPRRLGIGYYVGQIKWYSSIWTRKRFKHLVSKTAFWQKRYFSRTIGNDYYVVKNYIETQGATIE